VPIMSSTKLNPFWDETAECLRTCWLRILIVSVNYTMKYSRRVEALPLKEVPII
jgi:hypothetical protein